jgi:ribosomal protein S18 acetylase RimI-like enzyme
MIIFQSPSARPFSVNDAPTGAATFEWTFSLRGSGKTKHLHRAQQIITQQPEVKMTIREVKMEDAPSLRELLIDIGWFNQGKIAEEGFIQKLERMVAWNIEGEDHLLLVAEENGEIIGYVAIHFIPYLFMGSPEGYISELFVKNAARGKGVGSRLLSEAVKEGISRGCSRLQLVNMKNRESYARGFYTARGWRERVNAADFVYEIDD